VRPVKLLDPVDHFPKVAGHFGLGAFALCGMSAAYLGSLGIDRLDPVSDLHDHHRKPVAGLDGRVEACSTPGHIAAEFRHRGFDGCDGTAGTR